MGRSVGCTPLLGQGLCPVRGDGPVYLRLGRGQFSLFFSRVNWAREPAARRVPGRYMW